MINRQRDKNMKCSNNFMYNMKKSQYKRKSLSNNCQKQLKNIIQLSKSLFSRSHQQHARKFIVKKLKTLDPAIINHTKNSYHLFNSYCQSFNKNQQKTKCKETIFNYSCSLKQKNQYQTNIKRIGLMFQTARTQHTWNSLDLTPPKAKDHLQKLKLKNDNDEAENPEVELYKSSQIFVLRKNKCKNQEQSKIVNSYKNPPIIKYKKQQQCILQQKQIVAHPAKIQIQNIYPNVAKQKNRHYQQLKFVNSPQTLQPWISITEDERKNVKASPLSLL